MSLRALRVFLTLSSPEKKELRIMSLGVYFIPSSRKLWNEFLIAYRCNKVNLTSFNVVTRLVLHVENNFLSEIQRYKKKFDEF